MYITHWETNIAFIEGIVSYIFYVLQHYKIWYLATGKNPQWEWRGITLESFTGLTEQTTEKKLFSQECMYNAEIQRSGRGLLFLRNLNCGYKGLLTGLADAIRTNYLPGTDLIFVVSTDKAQGLPREFLDLFEIIRLEPEQQSKALDKPQVKPEPQAEKQPPPEEALLDNEISCMSVKKR